MRKVITLDQSLAGIHNSLHNMMGPLSTFGWQLRGESTSSGRFKHRRNRYRTHKRNMPAIRVIPHKLLQKILHSQ